MPAAALQVLNAYLDDGGDEIIVVEQAKDGTAHERRLRAPYTTYHREGDVGPALMRSLKGAPHVSHIAREGDGWLRVGWQNDNVRRQARYKFKDSGIETFEGDVDPVMYFLVSTRARIAKPRRCYLDFETDSRVSLAHKENMRVLSWSVTDQETGETWRLALEEDTDEAETELLENLVAIMGDYDQIVTWEGDWKGGEFDSFIFEARCRKRGLGVDPRRWTWLNQLAVWRRMNMHSAESGAEKESMKLEDIAFEQLGEGKQKAPPWVVERFGADRCSKGLGRMTWDLWEAGGEFRELLLSYNVRDTELLRLLELKKGYITLFQALCEVCGIPPVTRSLQPTRQMDGFLLRLGREHAHRFPTKAFREDDEEDKGKFKGAVVFRPKSSAHPADKDLGIEAWTADQARAWRLANGFKNGILTDIHVCDFTSLYPSLMRTFNLSAECVVGWQTAAEQAKKGLAPGTCRSPGTNLVTRASPPGFLPLAFSELIRLRKEFADLAASLPPGTPEWQDAMAKSTAYKVAANSFYGGAASKYSRFNNRDTSEACTQNGVHFLKITAAEAERRKMVVVYGDTDSVFTCGSSEEGYRTFIGWLNAKRFPAEVAAHGCAENHIKLAFEKTFERIVFVSAKAYVGRYSQYKGKRAERDTAGKLTGEPEIKGVAYKRGDKGKLTRDLQGRIIDCLVGGVRVKDANGKKVPANPTLDTPTEDLEVYRTLIGDARNHVLSDPLPIEEVRISKSLSKSLKEYAKTDTSAHVRVARELETRGQTMGKGSRVEFVVVDGSKSPQVVIAAEDYAGDLDRFYLWERVYEPSKSLLKAAFPDDEDWEAWGDVRPQKPRGRAAKVPEEQLGLMLVKPAPSILGAGDELAIPTFSATPLIVRVPESVGKAGLDRLAEVLRTHPGARAVEIVIVTATGEATMRTAARVSTGPRFSEAVARAIMPA
jgi:DNA polymerase elongation subunit (family B)